MCVCLCVQRSYGMCVRVSVCAEMILCMCDVFNMVCICVCCNTCVIL